MNKEQRKFKKVIKARKGKKSYLRRIKNSFGEILPFYFRTFRKSRKFKKPKKEKQKEHHV